MVRSSPPLEVCVSVRGILIVIVCFTTLGTALANPFFLGRFSGLRGGPNDTGPFAVYWNPSNLAKAGLAVQLSTLGVVRGRDSAPWIGYKGYTSCGT